MFMGNDANSWLFVLVALVGLIAVVTWPDMKGMAKKVGQRRMTKSGSALQGNEKVVVPIHGEENGQRAIDLKILSLRNLSPADAEMLETLDVVEPQARIVELRL